MKPARARTLVKPADPAAVARRVRELVENRSARLLSDSAQSRLSLPSEFASRIEVFARNLAQWGRRMNLTARPQDPEEVAFHVIDSLMGLPVCDTAQPGPPALPRDGQRVLDLGSGAGFPALILAAARPKVEFVLAEARRKRSSFLITAISEMELPNARVQVERLSARTVKAQFDAVTSRASGPIVDFLEIAAAALVSGGTAILYANPSQAIESRQATTPALGLIPDRRFAYEVERCGQAVKRLLATWRKSPSASV